MHKNVQGTPQKVNYCTLQDSSDIIAINSILYVYFIARYYRCSDAGT